MSVFYGSTVRLGVRTTAGALTIITICAACASAPVAGPMGEGSGATPRLTVVDSTIPPRHVTVQLDQPGYLALLLVAPGHSATLLYPKDSTTRNQFTAGPHEIDFQIPEALVDTGGASLVLPRRDTSRISRPRPAGSPSRGMPPLPPTTPTYLLVVTSSRPLTYGRIIEKTVGVSIPLIDTEALNAVGKAIKSTIASEPREWAGYYARVDLRRER